MNKPVESKLGELVSITGGGTPRREISEYWNGEIPWVTVKDFTTKSIITAQEKITPSGLKNSASNLIPAKSILMPTRMALGKIAINEVPVAINQDVKALQMIDPGKINLEYLAIYLSTISHVIENAGKGATVKGVKLDFLRNIKIPLPALDDQIRIATVLTRAEKLIAKRKESIQGLDELLKSTFFEMFGPSSIEYHKWPVVEIKDLAASHKGSMRTGPFGSNLLHSEFVESGDVAVLGIDNAVQNKFAWDQRRYITMEKYGELIAYRIFPGDVIITIMGTVGRSAVIPDDIPLAINTKHLAAITLDKQKANPIFLSYSIHTSPYIINQFVSKNRGAIMNGLNLGLIKETKLRKPPIELQNQFAAIAGKVETLKSKYIQNLIELENIYGSLSQRAFKGELDLSKVVVGKEMNEIGLLQEIHVSISGTDELIEAKKYSEFELDAILKSQDANGFTFESLMKDIEKASFHEMPSYEQLKAHIYNRLAGTSPILVQEYAEKNEMILRRIT